MTRLRRAWFGTGTTRERSPTPLGWLTAVAVVVAVAAGVSGALQFAGAQFARGSALMLVAAALIYWPRAVRRVDPGHAEELGHEGLALLLVCALAVFFRTYQLEPPGLWGDEAINGLRAFDILDGKITSPFQLVEHPHTAFHALTNYPIAAAFRLFGAGPVTLRLPGILAGIACVPLLYATVAPLFGARVALIAALFFASSPMQIAHAKGLTQIVFGECAQLAGICLLVRGAMGPRRWLMAAAGIPLGLCVYMYHSAKLAPLVAAAIFLWPLVKREPGRPAFRWWLALAAVFAVTALPAAISYASNPEALTGRASGVALLPVLRAQHSFWPLWDAVWRTLTIHLYQQGPVEYHWFGLGTVPGSNAIVAFLAVAGFLLSLWHWRETRHGLLLFWFLIGLIPGFLSTEAPRGYRVLYASPPIYVWAALPLGKILHAAAGRGWAPRVVRFAVALVIVAVPFVDFNDYFYRVYTHPVFRWFQGQRMVEMARTLRSYGPGWTGVLISDSFDARYESLQFLARAWDLSLRNASSWASELPVRAPDAGVLFIFDAGSIPASIAPKAFYPEVELDVHAPVPQQSWWLDAWLPLGGAREPSHPVAAFLPVSRDTVVASRGLIATFAAEDGGSGVTRIAPNLDFTDAASPAGAARWTGAIYAPADGLYDFALQSTVAATVRIDGRLIVSHDHSTALEPLVEGLHSFSAEAASAAPPGVRLLWRPPGERALATVPSDAFFRFGPVFGLRAEYEIAGRSLARIEPYPYYSFFAPTFDHPFTVRWRGTIHIPEGGDRIDWTTNGQATLMIDGRELPRTSLLTGGAHDFNFLIRGVPPVPRLQFAWHRPDGRGGLIPPQAFEPPR